MECTRSGTAALVNGGNQEVSDPVPARSLPIASRGLKTTRDVKRFAFAVAEDVILGAVAPRVASSSMSAVSVGLRTMQLEMRHAENLKPATDGSLPILEAPDPVPEETPQEKEIRLLEARLAELRGKK